PAAAPNFPRYTSPMALDSQDIARIAHLARLQLAPAEAERMQTQINGFFDIVEKMRAVDTSGVEPLAHPVAAVQEVQLRLRDEVVTLSQARAADERIAKGDGAPLLGVPIAHKDIFVTKDFASTAGSRMLEGYRSPFDATVVAKLAEAGCVTLGKLNCDEFAMG